MRAILGILNAYALLSFRRVVWKVYGRAASNWFVLLQATQFHLMYYASRTLPNMFAFGMSECLLTPLRIVLTFFRHIRTELLPQFCCDPGQSPII